MKTCSLYLEQGNYPYFFLFLANNNEITHHYHTSLKTQQRLIKSLLAPYQEQQRDGQGIVCSRAIDVDAHTAIEMWLALGSLTVTYEWCLANC